MTSLKLLLLFLGFKTISGKDFLLEALKESVDWNSDPCEDFYRHVCPLNKTFNPRYDLQAINGPIDGYWKWFQISEDFSDRSSLSNIPEQFFKIYTKLCTNGEDVTNFLLQLEALNPRNEHFCENSMCFLHLKDDSNCTRVVDFLTNNIFKYLSIEPTVTQTFDYLWSWGQNARDIAVFEKNNLHDGFNLTNETLEKMKTVVSEWIEKTPWVNNNGLGKSIQSVVKSTVLRDRDIVENKKETFKKLLGLEMAYNECKTVYNNSPDANMFCFWLTGLHNFNWHKPSYYYDSVNNAFNKYTSLTFGLPFIYLMQHTEEMAAKLGDVGTVIGHELGHSIVAGIGDTVMQYYSENAAACVQQQYNSTCIEFEETSCVTEDIQRDENGADILGLQLAYHLLEEHYKETLQDIYVPLNVTYQQMFFYSSAYKRCRSEKNSIIKNGGGGNDTHASNNVRVNAMAQHPGFKEAFKCPDDSRMMKSVTDQCIIYGENAPAVRRK